MINYLISSQQAMIIEATIGHGDMVISSLDTNNHDKVCVQITEANKKYNIFDVNVQEKTNSPAIILFFEKTDSIDCMIMQLKRAKEMLLLKQSKKELPEEPTFIKIAKILKTELNTEILCDQMDDQLNKTILKTAKCIKKLIEASEK